MSKTFNLKTEEAAKILGKKPRYLTRLVQKNKLEVQTIINDRGKKSYRFSQTDIESLKGQADLKTQVEQEIVSRANEQAEHEATPATPPPHQPIGQSGQEANQEDYVSSKGRETKLRKKIRKLEESRSLFRERAARTDYLEKELTSLREELKSERERQHELYELKKFEGRAEAFEQVNKELQNQIGKITEQFLSLREENLQLKAASYYYPQDIIGQEVNQENVQEDGSVSRGEVVKKKPSKEANKSASTQEEERPVGFFGKLFGKKPMQQAAE